MQFFRRRASNSLIALLLMLAITSTIVILPTANAHDPVWNVPTFAFISIAPNPVGVGQTVSISYWLDKLPPGGAGNAGERWVGWTMEVTKPDDTKQTIPLGTSDPVGGGYIAYTPDIVGTYIFKFIFPGQKVTGSTGSGIYNYNIGINDTYTASTKTATLTVQQEQINSAPTYPLPTEYWAHPIEGQNTDWFAISSNWLAGSQIVGRFQPYGSAPNSAHVMWTKPLQDGGVVGGSLTGIDGMTFYDGTFYERKLSNAIIMNGRLYYDLPRSDASTGGGYVCVDLRTGEKLWWQNMTMPSFGQLYDYESMNQHGVVPNGFLWSTSGTTWNAYDSLNGNWLFTETDVPSGTEAYTKNGEIVRYVLNSQTKLLALWNNTADHELTASTDPTDLTSTNVNQWRPVGKTVNASDAYSWSVSIPWLPAGATIVKAVPDDVLLGRNGSLPTVNVQSTYTMWAMSLKPESRGQLLWMKNYDPPSGNVTVQQGHIDAESRVFIISYKELVQWVGYNLDTGEKMWGPTASQVDLDYYNIHMSSTECSRIAYGKLYSGGWSGIVYCYDIKNGTLLWTYGNGGEGNSTSSGLASPYGNYQTFINAVADGKIYLATTEHSATAPHWKGARIRCIDATNGKEVWTLLGMGSGFVGAGSVADGYLVYLNTYDMQMYSIGKGPSVTSVQASPKISVFNSGVLIEGSVIDTAAGTKQNEQIARFPNGVPVVSDGSMSAWMEYVYMQKPRPANVTGVPVTIDVLDSNGNYRNVGQTTTDESGFYSLQWTPDIAGKYTVIATFSGSESYWPSHAETAFAVDEAAATTAPQQLQAASDYTMMILGIGIAIIIAVAVGFAVTILMLRKRP
jgi:outer membrane protein assembly factor BamB